MKTIVIVCAVLIGITLMGGRAMGAGNSQIAMAAIVLAGKCTFSTGGSISFTLDPASDSTAVGTVTQPGFKCSKTAFYVITDNKGVNTDGANRRMKHASVNEYITYNITYTPSGTGSGTGVVVPMNIAATIPAANYSDARAGNYTDTITFTITP
ncbi:MAG: spore coat protein U domain-containing protein [Syntrophorhabdaceae bacterium]